MNTTAAVLNAANAPLQIEELNLPGLKPGQVLVGISYSGICHSQLNEMRGLKGADRFLPHTLGHEGSGIVEAVGEGVRKVLPGDHVVLTWIKGIGADVPSAQYIRKDGSIVNSGAVSTFMTKAVVSENRVVKICKEMPLKESALLGCAIPTGAGIVLNTAKIAAGSVVAVFGAGGIGVSALIASAMEKAAIIIVVDTIDSKLETAVKLGATHKVNAAKQGALSEIMKITGGRGVDYAIEAAGSRQSMETAFQSVRENGGLCIIAGNLPSGERISIDPFDLIKGRRIAGTWGGETNPDLDIPKYVEWQISGRLRLERLVSGVFSLKEINRAVETLETCKAGRILISMNG